MPCTPQKAAGWRTEPPVSLPSATGTRPAATTAALPPELPPGTRSVSRGLSVGPKMELSVVLPIANSSMFVLPTRTAPASFIFLTAVASYCGTQPLSILLQQVVSIPLVQKLSLTAKGTPASGPGSSPRAIASSILRAAASACSSQSVTTELYFLSSVLMRSIDSRATSSAVKRFSFTPRAISHAESL